MRPAASALVGATLFLVVQVEAVTTAGTQVLLVAPVFMAETAETAQPARLVLPGQPRAAVAVAAVAVAHQAQAGAVK